MPGLERLEHFHVGHLLNIAKDVIVGFFRRCSFRSSSKTVSCQLGVILEGHDASLRSAADSTDGFYRLCCLMQVCDPLLRYPTFLFGAITPMRKVGCLKMKSLWTISFFSVEKKSGEI